MTTNLTPNSYAIARNLRGFKASSLRVKITRSEGAYVWVVTADLLDAGTPLVLDASQIEILVSETVTSHKNGLVIFS